MTTLFTAESISKGGRAGTISTPDGKPIVTLGNPLEPDGKSPGPGPELLFAGAYSACFHGALLNAGIKLGTPITESTVRAFVSLVEDESGGYHLAVQLRAHLPGVWPAHAQRLMEAAHETCPYSKALRGETTVTLAVD